MTKQELLSIDGIYERGSYFFVPTSTEYYEYRIKWSKVSQSWVLYIGFFQSEIPIREVGTVISLIETIYWMSGETIDLKPNIDFDETILH